MVSLNRHFIRALRAGLVMRPIWVKPVTTAILHFAIFWVLYACDQLSILLRFALDVYAIVVGRTCN